MDDTIDNDEVRGEVDKKGDSNTVRLEMFSELWVEKEWLVFELTPLFIAILSSILSK